MKKFIKSVTISIILVTSIHIVYAEDSHCINNNHNIINIIGETHSDEECKKIKEQFREKSKDKKIILAAEGWVLNQSNEYNIFGIEDVQLHSMVTAFGLYLDFALYKIVQDFILLTEDNFEDESFYIDGYKKILKTLKTFNRPASTLRNIIAMLECLDLDNFTDIYLSNQKILENFNEIGIFSMSESKKIFQFNENHSFETLFFSNIDQNLDRWINLLRDLTNSFLQTTVKNELIPLDTLNQVIFAQNQLEEYLTMHKNKKSILTTLIKNLTIAEDFAKFQKMSVDLALNLRDPVFLKNIIKIFENNKLEQKPFYVLVGNFHAHFLYKELIAKGYTVNLNDRAKQAYDQLAMQEFLEEKLKTKDESVFEISKIAIKNLNHDESEMQQLSLDCLNILIENKLISPENALAFKDNLFFKLKNSSSSFPFHSDSINLLNDILQKKLFELDNDEVQFLKNHAIDILRYPSSELDIQFSDIYLLYYLTFENLSNFNVAQGDFLMAYLLEKLKDSSLHSEFHNIILHLLDRLLLKDLLQINATEANLLKSVTMEKLYREDAPLLESNNIYVRLLLKLLEKNLVKTTIDEAHFLKSLALASINNPLPFLKQDYALYFLSFLVEPTELFPLVSIQFFEHLLNYLRDTNPKFSPLKTQYLIRYYSLYLKHPDEQITSLATDIISKLKTIIPENPPSTSSEITSDNEYSLFESLIQWFYPEKEKLTQ